MQVANQGSRKARFIRRIGWGLTVVCLAGGGFGIIRFWSKKTSGLISTAEAKLGEFVSYLELRGEVKARSSMILAAPFNAGDLQIIKLSANGIPVKKGDVVVQFDPTVMQRTVDQNRTALKQVDAEIDRLKAQQRMREEQTLTEKLTVRYNIERARLETGKEEVLPAIEIEKARLGLAKAEQKMREFEARQEADRVGAEADLTSLELKRDKAQADLAQAERSIAALTLTAPIGGVVTLSPNFRARTGMGMTAPMFKEGDRAWPGAAIAEIPDLESIQVNAPLDESERGALQLHQPVSLRIDAVPDREHKGVVEEISQLARLDYSSWPVKKNFDLTVRLEPIDSRLRPGMSATARVAVERLPDSILIPVEAVFEKGGRTVSFVQNATGFKEQTIEVGRRGEGQVLISRGLRPGQHVALKDPTGDGGRTK